MVNCASLYVFFTSQSILRACAFHFVFFTSQPILRACILHVLLHSAGQHGRVLDFNQRLEIAIDVAHALTYLHLYAGRLSTDYMLNYIILMQCDQFFIIYFLPFWLRNGLTDGIAFLLQMSLSLPSYLIGMASSFDEWWQI